MDFEREEDKRGFRWYRSEETDGWVPSATTVGSVIANRGLEQWFKNSSEQEIREKTEHGSRVGTLTHECIEELLEDGSTSINNIEDDKTKKHVSQYLTGFVNFYENNDLEVKELEVAVYNEIYGVAGTIDFVGKLNGELIVGDWKTSNSKDMWKWSNQLTFYGTSKPFTDKDIRPDLKVIHLKRHTNKGYQIRDANYVEDRCGWVKNIFDSKYDEPKFPEEIDTEFQVSDSDEN